MSREIVILNGDEEDSEVVRILKKKYRPYFPGRDSLFDVVYIIKNLDPIFWIRDLVPNLENSKNIIELGKNFIDSQVRHFLSTHPRAKLLLYQAWETADLSRGYNFELFIRRGLCLPLRRVVISTCDFYQINRPNKTQFYQIPYDWVYLREKFFFNSKNIAAPDLNKSRYLISLNRRANLERFPVAAYLKTKYPEKCYLSFIDNKIDLSTAKNFIKKFNIPLSDEEVDRFYRSIPLLLDPMIDDDVVWHSVESIKQFLNDSYFMLTFETNWFRSNCQQVSEKTYKAIKSGMPFLLFTSLPGILEHLRSLGFKTFHCYLDESYDEPGSYEERYGRLIRAVDELMLMSHDQIRDLYRKCLPIALHNVEILKNMDLIPDLIEQKPSSRRMLPFFLIQLLHRIAWE